MQFPNIDPVILHIYGPIAIRWYSIPYLMGIMVFRYFVSIRNKKYSFCTAKDLEDISYIGVLATVIGARLGYVLFYNSSYYLSNPLNILSIWEGGLSFHGGAMGFFIALHCTCLKRKINPAKVIDSSLIIMPVMLFFGRIANFINGELYGRATKLPIGVIFPTDPMQIARHPSQLYEAISEGVILGIIMLIAGSSKTLSNKNYFLSAMFIFFYSIMRFIVEFFREPDSQVGFLFGYITMGQILCFIGCAIGIFFMTYSWNADQISQKN